MRLRLWRLWCAACSIINTYQALYHFEERASYTYGTLHLSYTCGTAHRNLIKGAIDRVPSKISTSPHPYPQAQFHELSVELEGKVALPGPMSLCSPSPVRRTAVSRSSPAWPLLRSHLPPRATSLANPFRLTQSKIIPRKQQDKEVTTVHGRRREHECKKGSKILKHIGVVSAAQRDHATQTCYSQYTTLHYTTKKHSFHNVQGIITTITIRATIISNYFTTVLY